MLKFILLVLLLQGCAHLEKPDFWTDDPKTNTAMIAMNVALVADWAQTREIADNDEFYEKNSNLGPTPTSGDVNRFFVREIITNNLIGSVLPAKIKTPYYTIAFIYRMDFVLKNHRIGISMRF